MNTAVFGHGQLRLWLLVTLAERGAMSGYDLIRELEQRFDGLYSPSAGTVYPRLAKLEEEGLVTRTDEGRRSIYAITEAGRAEVASRAEDVAHLDTHVNTSSEQLADELQRRVAEGAAHITSLLGSAAATARAEAERSAARRRAESPTETAGGTTAGSSAGSAGGQGRDAFTFPTSFESFEKLARDLGRAERFRAEHAEEITQLTSLARHWRDHPWVTNAFPTPNNRAEAEDSSAGQANDEQEVDEDIIDVEVVGEVPETTPGTVPTQPSPAQATDATAHTSVNESESRPEPEDRGNAALDEGQVRRVIGILRTAADDLEAALRPRSEP